MKNPTRLPQERLARATGRDVAIVLISLALFFLLANVSICVALSGSNARDSETYTVYRGKWSRLLKLKKPVDTLVLGDSSGLHGVDPDVLEELLGGQSLNFCTWGNALVLNDAWMLQSYVAKFGPPRRVVIVHVYDVWRRELNLSLVAKTPLPWGYWAHMDPPVQLTGAERFQVFLSRFVPLVSQDKTMQEMITKSDKLEPFRKYVDKTGFYGIKRADPADVRTDCLEEWADSRAEDFAVSAVNVSALDSIARLAESRGFPVYLVNAPIYEGVFRDPAFVADYDRIQEFIAAYVQSRPALRQVFRQPRKFKQDDMENIDHLIARRAEDFSRDVGSAIRALEAVAAEKRG